MKNSIATDTLKFLAIHNSWRRGDETVGMQNPTEIGAAIDDAINLLGKYDELEKDNAILKKKYNILFRHMTDANVQMHKAIMDSLEVGGENILTF